jgi:acetyl-CoA C-acetyltransferase
MLDLHMPVIVAAVQTNERDIDIEPMAALISVVGNALAQSGAAGFLTSKVGSVRVLQGMWSYSDPGRLVANAHSFGNVQTTLNPMGGNEAYDLVNTTAAEIQAGRIDVAILCASESGRTSRRLRKRGERIDRYVGADDSIPNLSYGDDRPMQEPQQTAVGAHLPVNFYALVESAIGHSRGVTVESHRQHIAALWAQASEVAAENRFAAIQQPFTALEIATESLENRMIATPYTKLMTANLDVDMSAAIVMCSLGTARDAGIPDKNLVFISSGAGVSDHWSVNERWALNDSPAMKMAGSRALALSQRSVHEIDDLDLYSCFPSAVQLAQNYLGIEMNRQFTITGGLTFAGGPLNSYCFHALATAYERIVFGLSASAMLTGNGGYFSKHSATILTAEAPKLGFLHERPQAEIDAGPRRTRVRVTPSSATIETATVTYKRDAGPNMAIISAIDIDGARHWASSVEGDVINAVLNSEVIGLTAQFALNFDNTLNFDLLS